MSKAFRETFIYLLVASAALTALFTRDYPGAAYMMTLAIFLRVTWAGER